MCVRGDRMKVEKNNVLFFVLEFLSQIWEKHLIFALLAPKTALENPYDIVSFTLTGILKSSVM